MDFPRTTRKHDAASSVARKPAEHAYLRRYGACGSVRNALGGEACAPRRFGSMRSRAARVRAMGVSLRKGPALVEE